MSKPDRPQELPGLGPPDPRGQNRPDKVPDDGEMRGRVGDLAEAPLPPGEPLAVDLEVEDDDGGHEGAPHGRVEVPRGDAGGHADGEEHAHHGGGEEEVDTHRVEVLALHGLEVEGAFEGVGDGDGDEDG